MFSGNKKIIVYITKNKLSVVSVYLSAIAKVKILEEYDWTKETLIKVLTNVKKKYSAHIRILLGEELCYVCSTHIVSSNRKTERELVREKAQQLIPEDLQQTIWDFKEIGLTIKDKSLTEKTIQVVAVVGIFYQNLRQVITEIGLTVEAIEPVSYSIARLTEKEKTPQLILHLNQTSLLVACYHGLVVTTQTIEGLPTAEKINQYVQFVNEKFNFKIETIIAPDKFKVDGVNLIIRNLNPFVGLAMKTDIHGDDEKVLNLEIKHLSLRPKTPIIGKKPPTNKHWFWLAVVLIFIGLIIFIIKTPISKKFYNSRSTITPTPINIIKKKTNTTSSSSLELSSYKITLLNGSGKRGEAAKLKDTLEEKGFQIISTDNADRSDYQTTIVKNHFTVQTEFQQALDKVLKTIYTEIETETFSATEEADVVIIIGLNSL